MSSDFAGLIADIEREAHEEGSRAVGELERFRAEFGLAGAHFGIADPPLRGQGAVGRCPEGQTGDPVPPRQ
jgi:hypothetical protein